MEMFDRNTECSDVFPNIGNVEAINYESVCEIEKELEPYHIYSLVFLLYDVAHTALQRLTIYQRVSKDSKTNLLSEWVLGVQNKYPVWRWKFIEALAICQLYKIIRKLGLNLTKINSYLQPHDLNKTVNIHLTKKILYNICENVTHKMLGEIKSAIGTYEINVSEYQTCELVFLKLMSENFISGNFNDKEAVINVEKLAQILNRFTELQVFAANLRKNHNQIRSNKTDTDDHQKNNESHIKSTHISSLQDENMLDEIFSILNNLTETDLPEPDNISSKQKYTSAEIYPLKNRLRPGVCYIINQEEFTDPQLNRNGSTKDSVDLKHTMEHLKFEVITHSNLKHKDMMRNISNIMKYRVHHDDSVFVLCILSHGIKDHVFSADSIPIKIDEIQNMFDAEDATHLFNIPKIFIIEACQIEGEQFHSQFEADSPKHYHIRKSDCLIFYATASKLEAYRHPEHGTIFIQTLCRMLKKFAGQDDVLSIFTRVNNMVRHICEKIEKEQIPIISTTLVKKLYLK